MGSLGHCLKFTAVSTVTTGRFPGGRCIELVTETHNIEKIKKQRIKVIRIFVFYVENLTRLGISNGLAAGMKKKSLMKNITKVVLL